MIVIVLRFSFKDDTSEAEKAETLTMMRRAATLDAVTFSTVGWDLGDPAEGYTHTYMVGLEDLTALEEYLYHPDHIAGDFVYIPRLARLASIRFSDDDDPGLAGQLMKAYQGKIAKHPDWAELIASIPEFRVSAPAPS
jgi:hypothetical protein